MMCYEPHSQEMPSRGLAVTNLGAIGGGFIGPKEISFWDSMVCESVNFHERAHLLDAKGPRGSSEPYGGLRKEEDTASPPPFHPCARPTSQKPQS